MLDEKMDGRKNAGRKDERTKKHRDEKMPGRKSVLTRAH